MTSGPETSPPLSHPLLDSGAGRETIATPWTNAPQPDIQESAVTGSPSAHSLLFLANTATSKDIVASQAAREFQIEAGKAKECPFWDRSSNKDSVSCKFSSVKEAGLFRHYIEDLAPWFDVCDQQRPFTLVVPRMAASSPMLLKAILAHSSHHISRVSDSNHSLPLQYQEECLGLLIPKLHKNDYFKDESILLATIFLRSFGEFEDIEAGKCHLSGTSLFIQAGGDNLLGQRNRVLDAAYWIHLRQEIYYALVEQCNIRANFDVCSFDSPADPRNDTDWCNRVVWICAQTLQWAFGGNSTADRWRELQRLVKEWEAHRPRTFEAILDLPGYPSPSDWNAELWYSHNEHVDAMEYLLIAKLTLTVHDPTIPKMGFRVQSAAVNVQEMTQGYIRKVCIIAKCTKFIPAKFLACNALFACGSVFTRKQDQDNVIYFLRDIERNYGYATRRHVDSILNAWSASP